MNRKALYSILSTIVAMIVLSISLVFAIGPKVSAMSAEENVLVLSDWDDFEINDDNVVLGLSDSARTQLGNYTQSVGCGWLGFKTDSDFDAVRLEFPEGVKRISSNFDSLRYLVTSIKFPTTLEATGDCVFQYFNALRDVEIPNGVIGSYAFYGCSNLKNVTIGNGVTKIGNSAFSNNKLEKLEIPESVMEIGEYAFAYAYRLKSVKLGNGINKIPADLFYSCYILREITIPDSVTSIDSNAFSNCYGLETITIPSSVTSIDSEAFYNCHGLETITIPSSVTSIDSDAFYNCYGLETITIPSSVTSMGYGVFTNCYALESINCEVVAKPEGWDDDWAADNVDKVVWGYVASYQVSFDTVGGNTIDNQVVTKNEMAIEPTTPTKDGYEFKGWFIGDEEYDFATPVTEDITLTAKWEAKQVQPEIPTDENAEVNNQNNAGLIAGIAGTSAGVLIIAGIVVGIIISKRRRK